MKRKTPKNDKKPLSFKVKKEKQKKKYYEN